MNVFMSGFLRNSINQMLIVQTCDGSMIENNLNVLFKLTLQTLLINAL